jgi:hypothetical protein
MNPDRQVMVHLVGLRRSAPFEPLWGLHRLLLTAISQQDKINNTQLAEGKIFNRLWIHVTR